MTLLDEGAADHPSVRARLDALASRWDVVVQDVRSTASSLVAFGMRDDHPVVLKVIRGMCDEWHSGAVLDALGAPRYARVHAFRPGAVLMERLQPGTSLADMVSDGNDDEAVDAIAAVARQAPAGPPPSNTPTAHEWGRAFTGSAANDPQLPQPLVSVAAPIYAQLCASQTSTRLVHGDLQHYNVLSSARGWAAIDPKGVIAEPAFEAGALLRNPHGRRQLVSEQRTVIHRAERFADRAMVDPDRVLGWAFTQAVLSLIWSREDGHPIDPDGPSLALAQALLPVFR